MKTTQTSKLLPELFAHIDENQRLNVLHIGAALPATVNFFSAYRCKLQFVDLFSELPFAENPEDDVDLNQQFESNLALPGNCQFDLCLFWDIFDYLNPDAIAAFMRQLKPHLHTETRAHGFTVHKLRAPQGNQLYSVAAKDQLVVQYRATPLQGYAPIGQGPLKTLLASFNFERSVLLADSRLEFLLTSKV